MAAVLEKQAKRWTYEDYYRLDDDQRHEIIDGNLLMAPAPDMWHQDSSRKLFRLIDRFVTRNKSGEVFYAPWYIGTAIAYEQGGYETSPSASNVAPEVEGVLMSAIRTLLQSPP